MINLKQASKNIKPFLVMEILDKAKQLEEKGHDVIHLEIGEPDFTTPKPIRDAAIKAIDEGLTGYTHSLGLPALRFAIKDHYEAEYGVGVDENNIIVSSGTSPLLLLSLATIIKPDDEILLTDPTYACYPNFINFLRGKCRFVKLDPESGFAFDIKKIEKAITKKTKALIINSPANPTGLVLTPKQLKSIASLGVEIISDEIYHGLVYKDRAHTFLEFSDNATIINGFSKLYAMSGWRIGFVISNSKRIREMQKMQQNFFISASNFGQIGAIAALKNAKNFLPEMISTYNRRRKLLLNALPKLGFGIKAEPTGAFYILADARKFSKSSYELVNKILDEAHVALTPGIDFGQNAEGFVRFAYTNSYARIEEALVRLSDFLT